MLFSVDRIVGGRAMLMGEDGKPLEVPAEMLPPGRREGSMVFYQNGVFLPADGKAEERRGLVAEMLARLLRQNGGEDD